MDPLPVFLSYGFDSARCGSIPGGFPNLNAMRDRYDTARNSRRYDTDSSMRKRTGTATGVHVCYTVIATGSHLGFYPHLWPTSLHAYMKGKKAITSAEFL